MSNAPYRPFIEDPAHRALLEGHCYVVLRACADVVEVYRDVREAVRAQAAGLPVSYLAEPHVTLGGFPHDGNRRRIRELVAEWAPTVAPLRIETEKVAVFPAPFQIVVVQVRKTPALFDALSTLRADAARHGLRDLAQVPADAWVFHMSVAYCGRVERQTWEGLARAALTLTVPSAHCVVPSVEIVSFEDGQESCNGIVRLSGT